MHFGRGSSLQALLVVQALHVSGKGVGRHTQTHYRMRRPPVDSTRKHDRSYQQIALYTISVPHLVHLCQIIPAEQYQHRFLTCLNAQRPRPLVRAINK